MRVQRHLFFIILFAALSACLPTQKGAKQVTCGENEAFDPVKRSCYSVYVASKPPVPTLSSVDINGETATSVILTYTDNKNELARFCSVTSGASLSNTACTCVNGVCSTTLTSSYLFYGQTTFTYTLTDNDGISDVRTVTVNVTAKNHAPVSSTSTITFLEDIITSGTASASDVDTPSGMNNGILYYSVVSQPSKGIVIMDSLGGYTYYPTSNINGSDTFTFEVRDNGSPALYSNTSTITVTITPDNDAPTLSTATQNISGIFNTATSTTLTAAADIDGDTLTYTVVTAPSYGALSGCLGGTSALYCTYTPNLDVSDDDRYAQVQLGGIHYVAKSYGTSGNSLSVTYVADGTAGSETVSVTGNAITVHISSLNISTSAQIKSAIDSSSAASALVGAYLHGSIYESASSATFVGGRNYTDTFSYIVNDGTVNSATTASVTVNYTSGTANPVIGAAQTITLDENTTNTFVLNLATDVNYKDVLTYAIVDSSNLHGTISGCANGTSALVCSYTPDKNYNGPAVASFTYRATDSSSLNSATQTVTFNITDVPQSPILCQYSSFEEANECGYGGCVGTSTPVGNIMPSKADIYYYQTSVAICWKSTGTGINDWTDINGSYLSNQTINEKDQAIIDTIRIDEGGGSGEDGETVQVLSSTITKVSGDNGLLNSSSLTYYYNSVLTATGTSFGSAVTSSDLNDFKIVINPVNGKYGVAKVDLVLEDSSSATTAVSFYVTVNPVSAQHKGWSDIQAAGPKVSKDGDLRNPTYPCNYSRYHCDVNGRTRQACKGAFIPNSTTASTSDQYAIFYNSLSDKCYYNSAAASATATWVEFNSVCNISSSYGYGLAGKASLMGLGIPSITPININDSYYDLLNDDCYRSKDISAASDWVTYSQTTSVTISWDAYQISGSGSIEGFNIYRRLAGTTFNYKSPLNKVALAASALSYTDNSTNSWYAPIPKTVYEYEVRPIINSISTAAYGYTQTIKVTVPDDNMALVHRWVANKSMCTKIHSSVDTNNNYRCLYQGPGDDGGGYYDVGSDLFVDVYEAGCNYSSSPTCDTPDGTCVGLGTPVGTITAIAAAFYYDRSAGQCYYTPNGAMGTWTRINGTQSFTHNYPELPPAVYMTQAEADTFCGAKTISNILTGTTTISATGTLPNRKLQMVYSDWSSSLTDSTISTYEAGLALSSSQKCNSASADGLTGYYTDADIPDSSSFYTLPGTVSSGIRSFITGSTKTSTCQSRYGVQDAIGNVSEWVQDRFKCTAIGKCEGVTSTTVGVSTLDLTNSMLGLDYNGNFQYKIGDDVGPYNTSPFYPSGPCSDTDSDNICNSYLTSWILSEGDNSAGRLWIPMGLPGHVNFTTSSYPLSTVAPWNLIIGNSSGILDEALHDDRVTPNTQNIYADNTATTYGCGSMATGGSYTSGATSIGAAGVYHFELVPCTNTSYGYLVIGDVSFKALTSTLPSIVIDTGAGGVATGGVAYAGGVITIYLTTVGASTASAIAAAVNASASSNTLVYAAVAGNGATTQSAVAALQMESSDSTSSRADIGFRCVYKLP